jgi:hypothetical protein
MAVDYAGLLDDYIVDLQHVSTRDRHKTEVGILVGGKAPAHAGVNRDAVELEPSGAGRPGVAAGGSDDHAEQRTDGQLRALSQPWLQRMDGVAITDIADGDGRIQPCSPDGSLDPDRAQTVNGERRETTVSPSSPMVDEIVSVSA